MTASALMNELDEKIIHKLNDLIEVNLDSEKGFRETADKLNNPEYQSLFREIADERSRQAAELKSVVVGEGESPETDGSFLAQAHRWWISARDAITTSKNFDVLAEAERGEDKILHMYEDVRDETSGSSVQSLLLTHHAQVKARHDRVRDLRDLEKEKE
jgi:uncharacterized protein (TIGR02284 family)